MDCSLPGSSVHGIILARLLEWVAISSVRGSSGPRDQTFISCPALAGEFFTNSATWEADNFPCGAIGKEMRLISSPRTPTLLSCSSPFLQAQDQSWSSLGQIFPLWFFKTHYIFLWCLRFFQVILGFRISEPKRRMSYFCFLPAKHLTWDRELRSSRGIL